MIASLLLSTPTWACGGFFCNPVAPVDQAGEEIVFEVDGDANQTNMHVRVQYTGPAEEFAWLVPVSAEPTLGVGTDRLFNALEPATRPMYNLDLQIDGCTDGGLSNTIFPPPPPMADASESEDGDGGSVSVVQQEG